MFQNGLSFHYSTHGRFLSVRQFCGTVSEHVRLSALRSKHRRLSCDSPFGFIFSIAVHSLLVIESKQGNLGVESYASVASLRIKGVILFALVLLHKAIVLRGLG